MTLSVQDRKNIFQGMIENLKSIHLYPEQVRDTKIAVTKAFFDCLEKSSGSARGTFYTLLGICCDFMKGRMLSYTTELEKHPLYQMDPKRINDPEKIKALLFLMININATLQSVRRFVNNIQQVGDKQLIEAVTQSFKELMKCIESNTGFFNAFFRLLPLYRHLNLSLEGHGQNEVQLKHLICLVESNCPATLIHTPTQWEAGARAVTFQYQYLQDENNGAAWTQVFAQPTAWGYVSNGIEQAPQIINGGGGRQPTRFPLHSVLREPEGLGMKTAQSLIEANKIHTTVQAASEKRRSVLTELKQRFVADPPPSLLIIDDEVDEKAGEQVTRSSSSLTPRQG